MEDEGRTDMELPIDGRKCEFTAPHKNKGVCVQIGPKYAFNAPLIFWQ